MGAFEHFGHQRGAPVCGHNPYCSKTVKANPLYRTIAGCSLHAEENTVSPFYDQI